MRSVTRAQGVWQVNKIVALTGYEQHLHLRKPISPAFEVPRVLVHLVFGPVALAASIARTAALRGAPLQMSIRWFIAAMYQAEWLICDGPEFELSPRIHYLADTERTAFAGRVGAGVADLFMNALGYTWRDNASSVLKYSIAHADFLYGGGHATGHGVVLAEAHGSFAARISHAEISRRGKRKYDRQVGPHVGKLSVHGAIVHGYSVAFGCRPGSVGPFLHLSETQVLDSSNCETDGSELETDLDNGASPAHLVVATFRANFSLVGAQIVVRWLDWIRGEKSRPQKIREPQFSIMEDDGRHFLTCDDVYSVQNRGNGNTFPSKVCRRLFGNLLLNETLLNNFSAF